ncbi:pyridoxamine 5'-phosphate oxidase family protein [Micromonospora sp. WMMD736]|uniref:pyridoxamine 5'-phosphate oxidase family protein n=1 Tax=Micromonospora sp. WMMD736 TaxID=3404112 RepID=UPI003B936C76
MTSPFKPVSILPESECWDLLSSVSLGRLVTSADGHPEIFPVNFVVQNRTVLFRTADGTKLITAATNRDVLFEADDHTATEGWSVIVKGSARILHSPEDVEEAEQAHVAPWTAGEKESFIRVKPVSVTGRKFIFGAAPDPDSAST